MRTRKGKEESKERRAERQFCREEVHYSHTRPTPYFRPRRFDHGLDLGVVTCQLFTLTHVCVYVCAHVRPTCDLRLQVCIGESFSPLQADRCLTRESRRAPPVRVSRPIIRTQTNVRFTPRWKCGCDRTSPESSAVTDVHCLRLCSYFLVFCFFLVLLNFWFFGLFVYFFLFSLQTRVCGCLSIDDTCAEVEKI